MAGGLGDSLGYRSGSASSNKPNAADHAAPAVLEFGYTAFDIFWYWYGMCIQADNDFAVGCSGSQIEARRDGTALIIGNTQVKIRVQLLKSSDAFSRPVLGKSIGDHYFHFCAWIRLAQNRIQQQPDGRLFIVTWDDNGHAGWHSS
jgi:hypothetical protein